MNKHDIIKKTFLKLLPLQILMVAVSSINSIIDGVVATNFIGAVAFSATGLFYPVTKLLDAVNMALLSGSQILCGRFIGKNEPKKANNVFSLDMLMILIFGTLVMLLCYFAGHPLAKIYASTDELAEYLWQYTLGFAPGIIGYLLASQMIAFLQIEHQQKRSYIGLGVMIVANVSLNILFVKVFDMGLFGLGLSTTISNYLYAIILCSYFFTKKASIRLSFKKLKFSSMKDIILIGLPGSISQFCQVIRSLVLNLIIQYYVGVDGVSAFSAVMTLGGFYYAATSGVANATSLMVSIYYGEEDKEGLIKIMKTAVYKGMGLVSVAALIFIGLSGVLTMIYYRPESGSLFQMTHLGFILFPLSMPFSCLFCVLDNYYQCTKHLKIVNFLSVVDGAAGVLLFDIILTPFIGMTGIWIGQVAGGILCILCIYVIACIASKKRVRSMEDLMLLPKTFGVTEENRFNISIHNMDEVIHVSEKVMDFCKTHQISDKHSYYAGLSLEEMASNIVEYGFKDKKAHSVDVCVVLKKDTLLIRLKDDCPHFNPKEFSSLINQEEDVTKNIGIRLIMGIAKDMMYQNSFGLNVLTILIDA